VKATNFAAISCGNHDEMRVAIDRQLFVNRLVIARR
jgi:hypothetical protein